MQHLEFQLKGCGQVKLSKFRLNYIFRLDSLHFTPKVVNIAHVRRFVSLCKDLQVKAMLCPVYPTVHSVAVKKCVTHFVRSSSTCRL